MVEKIHISQLFMLFMCELAVFIMWGSGTEGGLLIIDIIFHIVVSLDIHDKSNKR